MSALAELATFVATTAVPEDALPIAHGAFFDTLGVTLAGAVEDSARIVQNAVAAEEGSGPCTIFGTKLTSSASGAALANGTAAHALDFDDMCFVSLAHPSAPLVPAIWAVSEKEAALGRTISGRAILEAYTIGFELEAVLGRTMNPRHYQQGWHCTSTLGTLGAAAAAARLMRLDAASTAHCLAIAASEASGLKENFGAMTKPLHAGLAARNGVLAALLARGGFTAADRALEGPQGFLVAMGSEHANMESALHELGRRWEILATGITVKLYPSCAATHPALDVALDLRKECRIEPDQVASVEIEVDSITPTLLIHDRPQTGLQGKFSMPFCISAALVNGHVGLETFEASVIQEPSIQTFLPHVTMRENPALGKDAPALTQAIVTIRMRDGQVLQRKANGARGYPQHPAGLDELERKFSSCALRVLSQDSLDAVLATLRDLRSLPDVRSLTTKLCSEAPARAGGSSC
ncbi:MAG TPA: MmgE/PrpD family protein [Candidatus Angelobacter sp.]|nr:MmgE/PrpD family protein [Candidatus Angelobacter sp.]